MSTTTRNNDDVLIYSGGYLIRILIDDLDSVCIHAESVPPSTVADMLRSTGAGVLHNYDEATLFADWRERLHVGAPGDDQQPIVLSARVRYW